MASQQQQNNISLVKANDYFVPQIKDQLMRGGMEMTAYQRMCVVGAMQQIYQLMVDEGLAVNDVHNSINDMLLTVAALQLNANAQPREVYFQTRNKKDKQGNWHKLIEMGIEGDGNDALLNRFGRNVAYVHPFWQVREGDDFEYPKHRGIELTPPMWEPTGDMNQKVVHVVYPIDMYVGPDRGDDTERKTKTEYFITEREQVKLNLIAHMSNNLMREKDKANRMDKIKAFAAEHTLDEMLDSDEMIRLGKISPAWREPQSRETMIVRKMRNNIVKKIPKDFNNAIVQIQYEKTASDAYNDMRRDVTENANSQDFDKALENKAEQQAPDASPEAPQEPEIVDAPTKDTESASEDASQAPTEPESPQEPKKEVPKKGVAPFWLTLRRLAQVAVETATSSLMGLLKLWSRLVSHLSTYNQRWDSIFHIYLGCSSATNTVTILSTLTS